MEEAFEELRSVIILTNTTISSTEGFFHGWCKEPFYNDSGGYLTKTYALIELTNGYVKFIEPPLIRFKKPYRTEANTSKK